MPSAGIFIGRFQPLHNGHIEIINQMIQEVDHPVIIVGSEDKQYSIYHTELKLMYSCDERKNPVHIVQNWNDIRQRVDEFIFS